MEQPATTTSLDSDAAAGSFSDVPLTNSSEAEAASDCPSDDVADLQTTCELIDFLSSNHPVVRAQAVSTLVGLLASGNFSPVAKLCSVDISSLNCSSHNICEKVVRPLLRNIGSSCGTISIDSITALVNLSHLPNIEAVLLRAAAVRLLMDNFVEQTSRGTDPQHPMLNLILLSNLTRSEAGRAQLVGPAAGNDPISNSSSVATGCDYENLKPDVHGELSALRLFKTFLADDQSNDGATQPELVFYTAEAAPPNLLRGAALKDESGFSQSILAGFILVNLSNSTIGRRCILQPNADEGVGIFDALVNVLIPSMLPLDHKSNSGTTNGRKEVTTQQEYQPTTRVPVETVTTTRSNNTTNDSRTVADRRSIVVRLLKHMAVEPIYHTQLLRSNAVPALCCLVCPPRGPLRNVRGSAARWVSENKAQQPPLQATAGPQISSSSHASLVSDSCSDLFSGKMSHTTRPAHLLQPLEHQSAAVACEAATAESTGQASTPSGSSRVVGLHSNSSSVDEIECKIIDRFACGLVESSEVRKDILATISLLASASPAARSALKQWGVYSVLRLWHCIEPIDAIRLGIENMVHLLVFSEAELQQQDQDIMQEASGEPL